MFGTRPVGVPDAGEWTGCGCRRAAVCALHEIHSHPELPWTV
ncbi:hypothetical protein ACWGR4_28015 [Embleya sp. NPDC055664]